MSVVLKLLVLTCVTVPQDVVNHLPQITKLANKTFGLATEVNLSN